MRQLLVLLTLCTALNGYTQEISSPYAGRFQYLLDSICKTKNIKGISAAIYRPGDGLWTGVYGQSHAGVPISKDMYFPIGSNTKTFVAAAILKLQENGKLSIDDTIGTWIQHPNVDGQITIRQLLNHTSGLYDYITDYDFAIAWNSDFNKTWQGEEMLQFIKAPLAAAGTTWKYCNTNYLLAGIILGKVTNKTLQEALHNLVITPAGLSHTFLYPHEQPNANIPHGWSAYVTGKLDDMNQLIGYSNKAYLSMAAGAGGLISTAEDNVKFWNMLMSGKIISSSSVSLMKQLVTLSGADPYGMGLYKWPANGHTIYNHPGTCFAFLAENLYDNDNGVCISLYSNQDSVNNNYLFAYVVSLLHKAVLEMPPAGITDASAKTNELLVFPNPAVNKIGVKFSGPVQTMALVNTLGQPLNMRYNKEGTDLYSFDVSNLPAGTYVLRLMSGTGQYTGRFNICR